MLESDARTWAALVNVAAILGMVLSGGTLTVVAVLVIWLVFKERSALVDFHGKQQMNLTLTTIVAVVVGFIVIYTLIDNFRRADHRGAAKAGWALLIIMFPLLGALVYILLRPEMTNPPIRPAA